MISRILMEYLPMGGLPVYECTPGEPHYILDFADPLDTYTGVGYWREALTRSHRLIVPLNIDADLVECQGRVDEWIALAQELPGNGTLVFSIRTSAPLRDGTHYVCAGLVYTPEALPLALSIEDTDPAELIRQVLLGRGDHPLVQEALARQVRDRLAHERYWVMADAARAIERKKDHKAYKRAARLLHGCLTPKQRREWHKKNHIHVIGQDGQLYRIEARSHQNVFLIEDGVPAIQFCVVSQQKMPVPDLMLAQKLLLESNIEHFMKLANKWDLRAQGSRVRRVDIPAFDMNFDDLRVMLERAPILRVPGIPIPIHYVAPAAYFNVEGLDRLQIEEPEILDMAV